MPVGATVVSGVETAVGGGVGVALEQAATTAARRRMSVRNELEIII